VFLSPIIFNLHISNVETCVSFALTDESQGQDAMSQGRPGIASTSTDTNRLG